MYEFFIVYSFRLIVITHTVLTMSGATLSSSHVLTYLLLSYIWMLFLLYAGGDRGEKNLGIFNPLLIPECGLCGNTETCYRRHERSSRLLAGFLHKPPLDTVKTESRVGDQRKPLAATGLGRKE